MSVRQVWQDAASMPTATTTQEALNASVWSAMTEMDTSVAVSNYYHRHSMVG